MLLTPRLDGVSVAVKLKSSSARTRLVPTPEWLCVDVKAPATAGKANVAARTLLAAHFHCDVELLRGEHDSRKLFLLKGMKIDAVEAALAQLQLDHLPDVRDGLTRVERLLLFELNRAQEEFPGRRVPSAVLYGRLCEHDGVNLDPKDFEALLARLVRGG